MNGSIVRRLRGCFAGVLRADDAGRAVRFVIDRSTGAIAAPLTRQEVEADELVLYVPDEGDDAIHLLVGAKPISESMTTDRWLAYHGTPDAPIWCAMAIEVIRSGGEIADEPVHLASPIGKDEPSLCKRFNARRGDLSRLCAWHGVDDQAPVLVGVDPDGFDVRARTGLVRFEFENPAMNADAAQAAIEEILREGSA